MMQSLTKNEYECSDKDKEVYHSDEEDHTFWINAAHLLEETDMLQMDEEGQETDTIFQELIAKEDGRT